MVGDKMDNIYLDSQVWRDWGVYRVSIWNYRWL